MSPAQKIKLALTGAKDARGMLIRESSKIIALSVLANPRITTGEVEFFAKSSNLSEDVIRKIGGNAEWTRKNYDRQRARVQPEDAGRHLSSVCHQDERP